MFGLVHESFLSTVDEERTTRPTYHGVDYGAMADCLTGSEYEEGNLEKNQIRRNVSPECRDDDFGLNAQARVKVLPGRGSQKGKEIGDVNQPPKPTETSPSPKETKSYTHMADINSIGDFMKVKNYTIDFMAYRGSEQYQEERYHVVRRADNNFPCCFINVRLDGTLTVVNLSGTPVICTADHARENYGVSTVSCNGKVLGEVGKNMVRVEGQDRKFKLLYHHFENEQQQYEFVTVMTVGRVLSVPSHSRILLQITDFVDAVGRALFLVYAMKLYSTLSSDFPPPNVQCCDGSLNALFDLVQRAPELSQIEYSPIDTDEDTRQQRAALKNPLTFSIPDHMCISKVGGRNENMNFYFITDVDQRHKAIFIAEETLDDYDILQFVIKGVSDSKPLIKFHYDPDEQSSRIHLGNGCKIGNIARSRLICRTIDYAQVFQSELKASEHGEVNILFARNSTETEGPASAKITFDECKQKIVIQHESKFDRSWKVLFLAYAFITMHLCPLFNFKNEFSEVVDVAKLAEDYNNSL